MPLTCKKPVAKHVDGHRKRAFNKLLKIGHENMCDYEMAELMLFLLIKRKDVKPLAKTLINKFHTIDGVLNASHDDLVSVNEVGEHVFMGIKIISEIIKASLKSKLIKRDSIECFDDVVAYCKANMKHLVSEELRILFLDGINKIIADEAIATGDIDFIQISQRDILKKCLENGAKGMILVHNHASGDPTPSAHDISSTRLLKKAALAIGIQIVDHIIIGGDRYISFKALNIL
ncbi:MAG: DNA repair protein RadC [Holosporales bacterium]|jgi:DNA repair protein RadC|nr:DNA repair protein RadC [Holosporales bacterium]